MRFERHVHRCRGANGTNAKIIQVFRLQSVKVQKYKLGLESNGASAVIYKWCITGTLQN